MKSIVFSIVIFLTLNTSTDLVADENVNDLSSNSNGVGSSELETLSDDIQTLKLNVINLNRELLELEEQLLYPSSTKYSVFVTATSGQFFTLEGIKLKLDGKMVASHLYDDESRMALSRGGVHKLFVTNLSEGEHTLTAFFTGLGPNATPYKRAAELTFIKDVGQGFLELSIVDNGDTQEAEFNLRQW